MKKNVLWLDDIRDPSDPFWFRYFPNTDEVVWVKNYDEFISWINVNGLPYLICFDHDLADEHYTPQEYWESKNKVQEWHDAQNFTEKTGMDCAKWLVDYCLDNDVKLPKYISQSANPSGKEYILSLLDNFSKHQKS
jgi:hypothetical protein